MLDFFFLQMRTFSLHSFNFSFHNSVLFFLFLTSSSLLLRVLIVNILCLRQISLIGGWCPSCAQLRTIAGRLADSLHSWHMLLQLWRETRESFKFQEIQPSLRPKFYVKNQKRHQQLVYTLVMVCRNYGCDWNKKFPICFETFFIPCLWITLVCSFIQTIWCHIKIFLYFLLNNTSMKKYDPRGTESTKTCYRQEVHLPFFRRIIK